MNDARQLFDQVTTAVLRAESSLKDCVRDYTALEQAEERIAQSDSPTLSSTDREIARRGADNARRILDLLGQAWKGP